MEYSKAADFYGLMPGHAAEIADAEQAYIQALLTGTPCWICFPPEARTAKMGGFRRPVVKLFRALHGHPDSGTTPNFPIKSSRFWDLGATTLKSSA